MAEVIFAVMVLGIGLILLAAAFPVGIKQGEKTQDSTSAALIAQHALTQITKVTAMYTRPAADWSPTNLVALFSGVADRYAGQPLVMGLLDGSMTTDPTSGDPWPDLRAKLIYPISQYAEGPGSSNPTYADDAPQNEALPLGHAAYVSGTPVSFTDIWGYRFDGANVYENVQWVYPADRRYYWYAFYRQMYDDPASAYPSPLGGSSWTPNRLDAVRLDHITRRTYHVLIVACKVPQQFAYTYDAGAGSITRTQNRIEPPTFYKRQFDAGDTNAALQAYTGQWGPASLLAPIRIPATDNAGTLPIANDTAKSSKNDVISDSNGSTLLQSAITAGRIRRGGIVVDAWQNVYQIKDVGRDWVRLDRTLFPSPRSTTFESSLPLWFNPNAIAVFPTIVTKQADLP